MINRSNIDKALKKLFNRTNSSEFPILVRKASFTSQPKHKAWIVWDYISQYTQIDTEGVSDVENGDLTYAVYSAKPEDRATAVDKVNSVVYPDDTIINDIIEGIHISQILPINNDEITSLQMGHSTVDVPGILFSTSIRFHNG